jgi:hypothetical protein
MEDRMAQKVQTLLVDDLDGSDAETTVRFGLDGSQYEIDLSGIHAEDLRGSLALYVGHARRVSGTAGPAGRRRRQAGAADEPDSTEVREWARENDIEVKERGRVPQDIVARYKAATGK